MFGTAKIISEPERAILYFIGSGGLASLSQLKRRFWEKQKLESCRKALRKLENTGLLTAHYVFVINTPVLIFMLTTKAVKSFGAAERHWLFTTPPTSAEIKQQLYAQEIRLFLENKLSQESKTILIWKNERVLRRETQIEFGQTAAVIGDAKLVVQNKNGLSQEYLIEIDGDYFGIKLREKLLDYAATGKNILWVTIGHRLSYIKRVMSELKITGIEVLTVGESYDG